MTKDLERRIFEHKAGEIEGFTQRYQLKHLVCQYFNDVNDAIACEKRLKGWLRSRKIALIEKTNPRWFDLSEDWGQEPSTGHGWPSVTEMVRDPSLRSG